MVLGKLAFEKSDFKNLAFRETDFVTDFWKNLVFGETDFVTLTFGEADSGFRVVTEWS